MNKKRLITLTALGICILFCILGIYYYKNNAVEHKTQTQQQNTQTQTTMLETVNVSSFKDGTEKENRTLIDVRTPVEYNQGHIANAKNIDFYEQSFEEKLNNLDKNTAYSIYCRSGHRSGEAIKIMESLGFTNVLDLEGGVISWQEKGNTLCTNC